MYRLDDFSFDLPAAQIAQRPAAERDQSRLLCLDRKEQKISHHCFADIADILPEKSLVVLNDSRVIRARLSAKRRSGGRVELLLVEENGDGTWQALVRASKTLQSGEKLVVTRKSNPAKTIATAHIIGPVEAGRARIRITGESGVVGDLGALPLPPYIKRDADEDDDNRYQTIFARHAGSIAAPTAGLHFTPNVMASLAEREIETCALTLHVGPGTFQPVRSSIVERHRLESERYHVSDASAAKIAAAQEARRPIMAVGTTVVRTLESTNAQAGSGRSDLFISPGYVFRCVDLLLTNFHLPRSTLLMLVCAFAGLEAVLEAYREAVAEGYRFYSYGDAMLIL